MYDIDAGRGPSLRLNALNGMISADQEIAEIEKQMEALSLRHCELMEAKRVAFAQSRPIPASPAVIGKVTKAYRSGDTFTIEMKVDDDILSDDNDLWTHRHRVMAGENAMIARTTGHIDKMAAAAAGEIQDPAASLRRERN